MSDMGIFFVGLFCGVVLGIFLLAVLDTFILNRPPKGGRPRRLP